MTTTTEMLTTFRSQVPHLPRALGLVWHAAPRWTAAWSLLLVIQGILPVAMVYLTRTVVDRITGSEAAAMTPESLRRVIAPVIMSGCSVSHLGDPQSGNPFGANCAGRPGSGSRQRIDPPQDYGC